jgi:hypothetical protein
MGEREPVEMTYALTPLDAPGEYSRYEVGFELGAYDPTLPLILDPALLVQAGFIGGSGHDSGESIAVDADGNIYVSGSTNSNESSFPITVGPDLTQNGSGDAFIAKLNPAGTALLYAGYIGGDSEEYASSIAVDGEGNAYVTGITFSPQTSFPVTVGPDLTQNGSSDAFIAKVNAAGTALIYAGYIGGSELDIGYALAVDEVGNAYVTGSTSSPQTSFPVAVGPDLTFNSLSGSADAFVAKVSSSGAGLVYAGYIGGSSLDGGLGIDVDDQGSAYITGYTVSTQSSFPVIAGPDLTYNDFYGERNGDAFVAKVIPGGQNLVYAGYIGGGDEDFGSSIAVDVDGNAYITGSTYSDRYNFPVVVGPDLTDNDWPGTDYGDAFVAKVASDGVSLAYAGFIGGLGSEEGRSIAVDAGGNAYVSGTTNSASPSFPVYDGPDLTHNGLYDVFIARVSPLGTGLHYASYIGGSDDDYGNGIAIDPSGNVYITGSTYSTESSFPVAGGPDLTHNGETDAFVVKVGSWTSGPIDLSISNIELIQTVAMSDTYKLFTANKPALLRATVTLQGPIFVEGLTASLTHYQEGVAKDSLQVGPVTLIADVGGDNLMDTISFNLPADWLIPGMGYALQLDSGQVITETNETNNRYPSAGSQDLHVVSTPVLDVVIVPVTYARPGAPVTIPQVNDLSYLTWMPAQVYPVSQINYTVRSTPFTFTGDLRTDGAWQQLLDEITAIHEVEDPGQNKFYYGLVDFFTADGCDSGCTGGIGWLNEPGAPLLKTAAGVAVFPSRPEEVSRTLAHEVGHNFGRRHAPCYEGLVIDWYRDFKYPYAGGYIGKWGYNSANGQLLPPTTADFMGYCYPSWTSDYTRYGIYQAFAWVEGWKVDLNLPYHAHLPMLVRGGGETNLEARFGSRSLLLSGFIAADGSLQVGALFPSRRTPTPARSDSRYQAVLLDASGRVLASTPLELTELAIDRLDSGEMASGFRAALPRVEGLDRLQIFADGALVFERSTSGVAPDLGALERSQNAQGAMQLSWSPSEGMGQLAYRVLYSSDGGVSWQVLAVNSPQPSLTVPAELLQAASHPLLLVQASDGVQTAERVYDLAAP